jgi:hypothetical protein
MEITIAPELLRNKDSISLRANMVSVQHNKASAAQNYVTVISGHRKE